MTSIGLSLFAVLGYEIFSSDEDDQFTFAIFVGVQATIFGLFYDAPVDFEKESLESARAYHVDRFRTIYKPEFQAANGRLCCERYKCCVALGFGAPPEAQDENKTYHRWRAMALHKMLQDRK